jgi:class 3 adenylate cyclase
VSAWARPGKEKKGIFNTAGDSLVADFASAVDAVQCAVAVQEVIAEENADRPAGQQMRFRIGIHVGDIMVQGDNLFDQLEDNLNPVGRIYYAASTAGCIATSLSQEVGAALGAQTGGAKLREVASELLDAPRMGPRG